MIDPRLSQWADGNNSRLVTLKKRLHVLVDAAEIRVPCRVAVYPSDNSFAMLC